MTDDELADEVEKAILDSVRPPVFTGIDWAATEKMLTDAMKKMNGGVIIPAAQLVTLVSQVALETDACPYPLPKTRLL